MRFLFVLFLTLNLHAACENGIAWVGISDTHYGGTPWTWEQGTNAYGAISNELHFIETNHFPNFLVHCGDVGEAASSGGNCTLDINYTTYRSNIAVLASNIYHSAGNHYVVAEVWACWTNNSFPRAQAWTNGNYIFIAVGSHLEIPGVNAQIQTPDLDFLETVLTNAYPTWTNFIVMSHYSVVTNATFGSISYGYGLERLTNLFNYYRVVMYMHGHQHSVDSSPLTIPGTTTFQQMVPSLTKYVSPRGAYQLFTLTNTTLITRRIRTDTHAVESSVTNTVPQYVCDWPPAVTSTTARQGYGRLKGMKQRL